MRDSMIFYRSFFEAIDELEPLVQVQVYKAIFEYSMNGTEVELNGFAKTVWKLIKPQLDANLQRFENGKKGGRKKQKETETEPKANQKQTKSEANNNNNVNVNVNNNENNNNNLGFFSEIILTDFEISLKDFYEMRKKIKKPATDRAKELILKELVKLAGDNENLKIEILNQSTLNCWQNVYPLKNNSDKKENFASKEKSKIETNYNNYVETLQNIEAKYSNSG